MVTSAGMPLTRSCSQEEMAMASVTGVPANMPGVAKKLLGPRRTGEGVDMPCWFMSRRGDGIRRRGVPITGPSDLHGASTHHNAATDAATYSLRETWPVTSSHVLEHQLHVPHVDDAGGKSGHTENCLP